MKKRVLVGGMHHESDTFNPILCGKKDVWVLRGQALLDHKGKDSVSGAIATLLKAGYEVLPTLIARAVPNGIWERSFYESLKEEFLDSIRTSLPLDALCLSLHGSMRVQGIGEAEGDLLLAIRQICPDIPIFSSLDMHATVTKAMLENCNGFIGYKCAPHTDTYETGIHAANMTIETLEKRLHPKMAAVHIPMLIAGEQSETSVLPMVKLMDQLKAIEKRQGIMACSYLLGFPWADVRENGVTALVVADENEIEARSTAKELAELFWNTRSEFGFYNETHESDIALEEAKKSIAEGIWPVVISDSGDNPTAGSSQDVTNFLKMILKDSVLSHLDPPLCYQGLYDPEIVAKALAAGKGNRVQGMLGSKFDGKTSTPISIDALVKQVVPHWEGAQGSDLALLEIEGVNVIVTGSHVGCYDPEMMRILGVTPEKCKCIVVKLGYLEPEIRAIAKRSMLALTDGSTNEVFSRLNYENLPHPIYPLDTDFESSLPFITEM
ncbi:M81 family metallopeptidase [uncultured Sphaerochaeta sp.]|uniref:M81 family metallopeptidase n=1 Tax=uncultured Sphaerochaeta sp. TaxID=886478 RepID=UPI002A0A579D|nr:M81 family metallopeptidase [uncultured Sphaerochaeta sp.]